MLVLPGIANITPEGKQQVGKEGRESQHLSSPLLYFPLTHLQSISFPLLCSALLPQHLLFSPLLYFPLKHLHSISSSLISSHTPSQNLLFSPFTHLL
ncbi:hypothetical protein Pmani_017234 [Petrolisthes manimaculis]|uniref:Uncharacterized protein n=1 Tax=Petrolisthes manimaculis TaxID=1843537 RepID=A0AAE1PQL0_9EUCA|nr:hypothetical protein Pmani_017234 [Petrolisthes manimaculis]